MLDAGSGAPLRVVAVNQDPYGAEPYAVLVADQLGRVFVLSRGNPTFGRKDSVSVLDAGSGRLLYTTTVPAGSQGMAVDQRTWRAFILQVGQAGPGGPLDVVSLSTLAVTRGVVLRTVSVGNTLVTLKLALDEQTGRLFVLDDELFMLDARDGRLLGKVRTSGTSRPSDLAAVGTTRHLFVLSGRQDRSTSGTAGVRSPVRQAVRSGRAHRLDLSLRRIRSYQGSWWGNRRARPKAREDRAEYAPGGDPLVAGRS
jgi:hypothetical protein